MPTIADLTNASGFALFSFSVFFAALGIWRKWVVPGWIYQAEVDRRTLAETQLAASTLALNALTAAVRDAPRSSRARP